MSFIIPLVLALRLVNFPISSLWAQGEPPPMQGEDVSGRVVNLTTGEPAPEGLRVMLHGWGADGGNREMLHGELNLGGNFRFEDVPLEPDIWYAAMVVYQDVTYFSKPAQLLEDGGLGPIRIEVYETTSHDEQVSIDQLHIFLGFAQGGLSVGEVYAITNHGNRTVRDAVTLDDDQSATMLFSLPESAANLTFPAGPADRFVSTEGGFADMQPLIPGKGAGQVVVIYILPHEDALTLQHTLPYDTENVTVFLPHASGLSLADSKAEYLGLEAFAEEQSYEGYWLGAFSAGERIELSISGRPEGQAAGMASVQERKAGSGEGIALGAGVLGLALIVAGIWWWRREGTAVDRTADPMEAGPGEGMIGRPPLPPPQSQQREEET